MHTPSRIKQHAALLDGMAAAVGADLESSLLNASLSMDGLADTVLRCAGCARSDACEKWLNAGRNSAPDYCLNQAFLLDLAKVKPLDTKEMTRCR